MELVQHEKNVRYTEKKLLGDSMSIQLYKDNDTIIIFGIAKQYIKDEREFYGIEILNLDILYDDDLLKSSIYKTINELCSRMLANYN